MLLGLLVSGGTHAGPQRPRASRTPVPTGKGLWGLSRMSLPWESIPPLEQEAGTSQNRHLSLWFLSWVPRLVSLQFLHLCQVKRLSPCREVWEDLISKGGGKARATDLKSHLVGEGLASPLDL